MFVNKEVASKHSNAEMICLFCDRLLKSGGCEERGGGGERMGGLTICRSSSARSLALSVGERSPFFAALIALSSGPRLLYAGRKSATRRLKTVLRRWCSCFRLSPTRTCLGRCTGTRGLVARACGLRNVWYEGGCVSRSPFPSFPRVRAPATPTPSRPVSQEPVCQAASEPALRLERRRALHAVQAEAAVRRAVHGQDGGHAGRPRAGLRPRPVRCGRGPAGTGGAFRFAHDTPPTPRLAPPRPPAAAPAPAPAPAEQGCFPVLCTASPSFAPPARAR